MSHECKTRVWFRFLGFPPYQPPLPVLITAFNLWFATIRSVKNGLPRRFREALVKQTSPQKTLLLPAAFFIVQSVVGFCPPPGIPSPLNDSVCYQILATGTDIYSAAKTREEAGGGNLTSIHNAFTNSFLRGKDAEVYYN